MSVASDNDPDISNPYVLIHVLPNTIGEKPQREIIPAIAIKKFKYEEYKKNQNVYKKKKFSYTRGPEGEKYKCYILCAADTYNKVYDKSTSKRFSIPTHSTTIDETLNPSSQNENEVPENFLSDIEKHIDSNDDENVNSREEIISATKRNMKEINRQKKKHKSGREKVIFEEYMNQRQTYDNEEIEEEENNNRSNFDNIPKDTSTPVKDVSNIGKNKDAISELRKQVTSYKSLYINARRDNERLTNALKDVQNSTAQNPSNEIATQGSSGSRSYRNSNDDESNSYEYEAFLNYDKIYSYTPGETLEYDQFGNVLLAHGIPCNPKSYIESWKCKTPSQCLAILSQGVYEMKDLAERCVRKQKNTLHKKVLDPLKTVALEKQIYKFMRTKNSTIKVVEQFLISLNTVHHQCITKAIKRCQTLASFNEDINDEENLIYDGPLKS